MNSKSNNYKNISCDNDNLFTAFEFERIKDLFDKKYYIHMYFFHIFN